MFPFLLSGKEKSPRKSYKNIISEHFLAQKQLL